MGCGKSKPAVVEPDVAPPPPPPPEPEPEPEPVAAKPEPAPAPVEESPASASALHSQEAEAGSAEPEPEPEPEPVEPEHVVEDSSTVPSLSVNLAFLEALASELGPQATTEDVLQQIVLPRTRASHGRFAQMLSPEEEKEQTCPPTYFVTQSWARGYGEMVDTIKGHIHAMEPQIPLDKVRVFLDLVCTCQSHEGQKTSDLESLQAALAGAKTTLVVMDHQLPPAVAAAAEKEREEFIPHVRRSVDTIGTGTASCSSPMAAAAAGAISEPCSPMRASLQASPGMAAGAGAAAGEQRVCLVIYRSKQGLHGFHPFSTVHVKHL